MKDKVIVTVNGYAQKSLSDTVLDPLKPNLIMRMQEM